MTECEGSLPEHMVGLKYGYPMLAWPLSDPLCLGLFVASMSFFFVCAIIVVDPLVLSGQRRMQRQYIRIEYEGARQGMVVFGCVASLILIWSLRRKSA